MSKYNKNNLINKIKNPSKVKKIIHLIKKKLVMKKFSKFINLSFLL